MIVIHASFVLLFLFRFDICLHSLFVYDSTVVDKKHTGIEKYSSQAADLGKYQFSPFAADWPVNQLKRRENDAALFEVTT